MTKHEHGGRLSLQFQIAPQIQQRSQILQFHATCKSFCWTEIRILKNITSDDIDGSWNLPLHLPWYNSASSPSLNYPLILCHYLKCPLRVTIWVIHVVYYQDSRFLWFSKQNYKTRDLFIYSYFFSCCSNNNLNYGQLITKLRDSFMTFIWWHFN